MWPRSPTPDINPGTDDSRMKRRCDGGPAGGPSLGQIVILWAH